MTARYGRCTCRSGHVCPLHDRLIDEAEWERDLGEPMTERDYDLLEAGPWWNEVPAC